MSPAARAKGFGYQGLHVRTTPKSNAVTLSEHLTPIPMSIYTFIRCSVLNQVKRRIVGRQSEGSRRYWMTDLWLIERRALFT
jgi:hypothetical protein